MLLHKDGKKPVTAETNADKIRAGSDLYISVQIAGCIVSYLVQNKILKGAEKDHKDLISGISDDILQWLETENVKETMH